MRRLALGAAMVLVYGACGAALVAGAIVLVFAERCPS